jgi:ABC-type Fe3+-siderophore transport system permease subunit
MSTVALRGGQLSRIFGLLTLSVVGWMINTGAASIVAFLGGHDTLRITLLTAGIAIATLCNAAAAATQSLAADRAMKGSLADA